MRFLADAAMLAWEDVALFPHRRRPCGRLPRAGGMYFGTV
jgi:hypothetical protein